MGIPHFLMFSNLTDLASLGAGVCNCDVPCTRHQYDASLSSSLLDTYKIQDDIQSHEKSRDLLPRYQGAIEISAQVHLALSLKLVMVIAIFRVRTQHL